MGPERGLDFQFVDKQSDEYDYRVVLSAEGASAWDFAHGNIVVMNPEAKVLFTVTRSIEQQRQKSPLILVSLLRFQLPGHRVSLDTPSR